ncbi:hypothetical protein GGP63_002752 [Salinibacter ruber]|nr:hypothetical protein [Salinibacter ruber]MCS3648151.1 hypothetical protein [Salinibacter ruber]
MNVADGVPRLEKAKQIGGQDFLVGKVGLVIVALSLGRGSDATPVVPTNEQVDPNERTLRTHVAKGSCVERRLVAPFFKPPAATWFFNP